MAALRYAAALLRNLLRRDVVDAALDEDVRAYRDLLIDEKIAAGLPPDAARRQALLELGGVEQVKERVRDGRAGAWLDHLSRDLSLAVRSHAKRPSATAVIVATLALGIAATSAAFSLVNGFFIRPLPIEQPDRCVRLFNVYANGQYFTISHPDFADMRELTTVFAGAAAEDPMAFTAGVAGAYERLWGERVSEGYFSILGVKPAAGRLFAAADESAGEGTVVLSHGFWKRRFGGAGAVGDTMLLNGQRFRIVGVAAEGFSGTTLGLSADLWVPAGVRFRNETAEQTGNRGLRGLFAFVSVAQTSVP